MADTLRRTRLQLTLAVAVVIAAPAASMVASFGSAAASTASTWGYALADNAAATDYTPNLAYQRQSNGLHVTIHRSGVGEYRVTFPGLASSANGGVVQVTQEGGAIDASCQSNGWSASGADVVADVICFDGGGSPYGGTPDDMYFDIVYTVGAGTIPLAYAWDNLSTTSGNVASFWSFDGKGGTISSSHNATGDYYVTIPNLAGANGTVKVTPYGPNPAFCSVVHWGSGTVHVLCTDAVGNPKDIPFNITFANGVPLTGASNHRNGYVWNYNVNRTYTASGPYLFDSAGRSVGVEYLGTGAYRVRFGGIKQNHGDVQVTAYGNGGTFCTSGGWSAGASVEKVDVYCFSVTGPFVADTRFTVQWFM